MSINIDFRFNDKHDPDNGQFAPKDGSSSNSKSDEQSYDKYNYSSDIDENQPSISYNKQVNTSIKKEAIETYTAGNDDLLNYDNINEYLNGKKQFSIEEQEKLDKVINNIDSCISGETDKNMFVYRGIGIKSSELRVGDEIINKGFTSTSAVKEIADDFANYYNGTTIEIKVKKGTKALGIGSHTSGNFDEAEILFGRRAKIIITEVGSSGVKGEIVYE